MFGSWQGKTKSNSQGKSEKVPPQEEKDLARRKEFCPKCDQTLSSAAQEDCSVCGKSRPGTGWPEDRLLGEVIVGGQYRITRRLGSGGFGVVYEVATTVGGLRRALKVLKERWVEDEQVRDRFVNEALVLEQINHPNVARCFSAGFLDGGELYLLFELIDGISLADLIDNAEDSSRPVQPVEAVRIARQVASGLVAAHAKNVLHRDLKPANVLLENWGTPEQRAKLLDFGIAKLIEVEMTATGQIIGTPAFLAPEQVLPDLSVGTGVDLWQLGATMYATLTGRPPYGEFGDSLEEIISRFRPRGEPGPSPGEVDSDSATHPLLDGLISRLLATDPADRPDSATEVCEELARIEQVLVPSVSSTRPALLDALCAQPSENSWAALCRFLTNQNAETKELAEERLSSWPTELRCAAIGWWESTKRGETHPLWGIARSLDLSGRDLQDDDIEKLSQSSAMASIRRLDLSENELGPASAEALANSHFLSSLEHLELRNNHIGETGMKAIVESSKLRRLKFLGLSRNRIGASSLEALMRSELPLRSLDLSENDLRIEGAEALTQGNLRNLNSLNLRGNLLGPDGTALLAVSTQLITLRDLDLSRNALGPSGAAALAVSRNLARLQHLNLAQNNLGRQGLQLFLSSPGLDSLESFDVSSNTFGPNGAMALASSLVARRLRKLAISDNGIEDAGLAALLGAPQLTGLSCLRVAQNKLTPSGVGLFDGAALQVATLDLSDNTIGEKGAPLLGTALGQLRIANLEIRRTGLDGEALAEIVKGGSRSLESLDASHNRLDNRGIESLSRIPDLATLRSLALDETWSGSRGLVALASSSHLSNLVRLSVNSNNVGDEGLIALGTGMGLTGLEDLALADNGIGVEGAAALAASSTAARLRRLDLSYNRLSDAGTEAIAHGPVWQQLRELKLRTNGVGFSGASALLASPIVEMLQVLDLDDNPLRGELDIQGLEEDKISLMESTFATVSLDGAGFAETFYQMLFDGFPGVKPLFAKTSMSRQKQHLFSALTLVIENLRRPDSLQQNLTELGRRHIGYGVSPSDYHAVSSTLLDVIRQKLGDEWNDSVHEAWSDGLEAISRIMMNAHRQDRSGMDSASSGTSPE
jgi:serine/threonine protein kinase/hemoglobin-like flavoprotein